MSMRVQDDKADNQASAGMGTDETGPIDAWELCFEHMEQHLNQVHERMDDIERHLDELDDKISATEKRNGGLNQ